MSCFALILYNPFEIKNRSPTLNTNSLRLMELSSDCRCLFIFLFVITFSTFLLSAALHDVELVVMVCGTVG
jgi:hypothetical protein